uniref:Uncharacterized protein n=1 Tax=Oryza brachyantha TaxID=4533 RepID=J3LIT9_ORYBR
MIKVLLLEPCSCRCTCDHFRLVRVHVIISYFDRVFYGQIATLSIAWKSILFGCTKKCNI